MLNEEKPKRKNGMRDVETKIVLAIVVTVIFVLLVVLVSIFSAMQGEAIPVLRTGLS